MNNLQSIIKNLSDGKIGDMEHSVSTKTIVLACGGVLLVGIALMAIKKFFF